MKIGWNKVASALALVIGGMAVVAGGQVLLGSDPGYPVINWVPVYNYTVGILTVLVSSVLLWKGHRMALGVTIATLGLHTLVMLLLQTSYREIVAMESLRAMTIRLTAWLIILGLMLLQSRQRGASNLEQRAAIHA
jgi:hypothetical protein